MQVGLGPQDKEDLRSGPATRSVVGPGMRTRRGSRQRGQSRGEESKDEQAVKNLNMEKGKEG